MNFKDGNGNDPENFVPEGCPTSADDAVPADDDSKDDAPSLDDYRSDDTDRAETDGLRKAFSD
ncbi:hypothetical protein [Natronorubrum sp. A-ect3]|uniref:hypothetical protein n=1 Tax=Natronorubrum sp. A-ect3 TaxID=3242698 RepID=UPI00359EDE70